MKRGLILILICLITIQVIRGEDYLTQAKTKKERGLYWEAIELLEKALAVDSKNDAGWKMLGECYWRVLDFNKAKACLEKAQNINPQDTTLCQLLNKVKIAQEEELRSRIFAYNSYLLRYPKNNDYRLKLARAYRELGDSLAAQREYEICLMNNPKQTSVREEYLSFLRLIQRKPTTKIKKGKWSKAVAVSNSPNELLERARELVGKERYAPAESLYEVYLTENPLDTTALREYANMLGWNEEYDKSIAAYRRLLRLNPKDKKSRFGLAQVLSYKGDYNEAIEQYLTLDTTDLEVLIGLAQTYDWQGDYPRALKIYERILNALPEHPLARRRVKELSPKLSERTELALSTDYFWDSEKFYWKRYAANLRLFLSERTGVEPGFAYRQFEQEADFITAYSYSIRISEKLSEVVNGQVFYVYNFYDCLENTHGYGLSLNFQPAPNRDFNFGYDHYDIIEDVATTRSLIQGITTDKFTLFGSYLFEKGYGLGFHYYYGAYSDSNSVQNPEVSFFYRLFAVLTIGYRYYLLTYSFPSVYYWSPDFYQTHSIWFELSNGSTQALSYYVQAEIAKITNSARLARSFSANLWFNPPKTDFNIGLQFAYSELSRTADAPAYWNQTLAFYLRFKL